MADHANDTDPNNNAAGAPADANAGGGSSEEGQNSGNNDQNPDAGGEGGDSGNTGDGNQADEGGEGNGGDSGDVATRRHNKVNAATRVAQKNASQGAGEGQGEGGENPTEIESLRSEVADLRSREEAREDEAEINQIVAENEDFKPYVDKVKKLAKDPSRKQVPIKSLFYEAAGDDLIKIGANRASEANADAAETQQNGTSTGNAPTGVSVNDMSNEDFQKMQEEVRLKQ